MQAGDSQARVQAGSMDCLLHLAAVRDAGVAGQTQHFLKPERAAQWKRVLARLQARSAPLGTLPACTPAAAHISFPAMQGVPLCWFPLLVYVYAKAADQCNPLRQCRALMVVRSAMHGPRCCFM